MMHQIHIKTPPLRSRCASRALTVYCILCAVSCLLASPVYGQHVLYLRDGRTLEGSFKGISNERLQWQMGAGSTSVPLSEVKHIDFPAPQSWYDLMEAFEGGDFAKTAAGLEPISRNKTSATFYPAPGNFASLAERRLLDCYRKLRDWRKLRFVFTRMEWEKLPYDEQEIRPVMAVWSAIGGKDWDESLELAAEAEEQAPGMTSELGLARAIAYQGNGDSKKAVIALAEAFGPYPGLDRAMAKDALVEAATILAEDPERQPELTALVHIYAGLYGQGKLWDDAPPLCQELLAKTIDTGQAPATSKGVAKLASGAGLKARYIRVSRPGVQQWGLVIGEVEVMSGGYNIAEEGKPKFNSPPRTSAGNAIDGETEEGSPFAATEAGVTDPWWELDMGKVVSIESIVVWAGYKGDTLVENLSSFDLELLDGDRNVVFERRDQSQPKPKLEFVVE